jgi:lipid kinase YegS
VVASFAAGRRSLVICDCRAVAFGRCDAADSRLSSGTFGYGKRSKPVEAIRIILHGKAAGDARVRTAVHAVRQNGHFVEVRVTWEPGDAARLTAEAVADAGAGKVNCIVAGGGDGTINEVFAAAYGASLPERCSLGVLPLGTANDFAHATGVPVQDLTAALELAARTPPRWIDVGFLNGKPFINLVSGGFGSRVTVETDPDLKRRLGGLAYVLTGISRFAELSANRGSFRAEGLSWEGPFVALAIGNGRQAGGGVQLCPDALLDDGLLDLMILPELDHAARLDAFSHLLREGAAAVRAQLVTARSSWIEYQSENDLNVNLDGEPMLVKQFRVECRRRVLPVHLGDSPLISRDPRPV